MDCSTYIDANFSEKLQILLKQGQIERVKGILHGSFLYSATDKLGATLLHYSAQYNDENFTQYLLDKGLDVDVQDSMGNTPLMIAVTEEKISVTRILLEAGADIFKLNNEKKSVLHILSTQQAEVGDIIRLVFQTLQKKCPTSEEVARMLVDANCHLFQASILKDATVIECMLEAGSPVGFTHSRSKFTAVHGAAIYDDSRSMKVLVKHGANINALDDRNENALCKLYTFKAEHNSAKIEILQILLNGGVSMNSCTNQGLFQTYNVLTRGNREAVRMLIESGLDFNVRDNRSKKGVLHYCVYNPDPEVAEELKLHVDKFNINARDKYGQTPLHLSAFEGNVSMLKFLLKHGARPNIKSVQHFTPLYYCYRRTKLGLEEQYRQCSEILLLYHANPQLIVFNEKNRKITIFDYRYLKKNNVDRIKPVVAHLAMIEKLGRKITKTIWMKINSRVSLKEYFKKCQNLLTEKISGQVALHDLLVSDKKKMVRYLNNKSIIRKLQSNGYKLKISRFPYYMHALDRHCFKAKCYQKWKNEASGIIRKIFQNRIHETDVIVEKIIDYLNNQSLQQLYRIHLI